MSTKVLLAALTMFGASGSGEHSTDPMHTRWLIAAATRSTAAVQADADKTDPAINATGADNAVSGELAAAVTSNGVTGEQRSIETEHGSGGAANAADAKASSEGAIIIDDGNANKKVGEADPKTAAAARIFGQAIHP
jgi:hypothetical protein